VLTVLHVLLQNVGQKIPGVYGNNDEALLGSLFGTPCGAFFRLIEVATACCLLPLP